jgi:tetratricopeptide (TPR) repeat protein
VLCRLAVFQGGFEREAGEQVAGASLPSLLALASKSLVRRAESGRYDLHEVVDDPGGEATRDRHCDFYLALLRDREGALQSAAQREAIRELTDEIDNMRAAWARAVEREKFGSIGPASRCFAWFYDMQGWLREGIEQMELAAQALRARSEDDEHQRVLGQVLAQQGMLLEFQGQYAWARTLFEESLAVLRPIGDLLLLIDPLIHYGIVMYVIGEIDLAQSFVDEGLACARAAGDQWSTAYGLCNQGYISNILGRYAEGYEQMLAGLATWRALGDSRATALGLNWLSPTAIQLGRYEEAQAFLQESLALSTQVGDRWGMGTAYRHLGLAAMVQGSLIEAQFLLHKSLELFAELGTRWDWARSLIYLGEATAAAHDTSEARQIFLDALQLAMELQAIPLALDALMGLAHLQAQTGKAEAALELSICVASHPSSTQEAKDRAGQLRVQLETQLTPGQVAAAQERAGAATFDALVTELLCK